MINKKKGGGGNISLPDILLYRKLNLKNDKTTQGGKEKILK